MKLSFQSDEITLQLKTASVSCLTSSTPTNSFQHLSYDATWNSSLRALHFMSALRIWVADTLGGGPAVGGNSGSSLLGHTMWQIPLSTPQTSPARWHTLPHVWHQCKLICPLDLRRHASFLQGILDLELCTPLLYSSVQTFIPPPRFWFPFVFFGGTTNFGGSI